MDIQGVGEGVGLFKPEEEKGWRISLLTQLHNGVMQRRQRQMLLRGVEQ